MIGIPDNQFLVVNHLPQQDSPRKRQVFCAHGCCRLRRRLRGRGLTGRRALARWGASRLNGGSKGDMPMAMDRDTLAKTDGALAELAGKGMALEE